jgi:hypothetical protein
VRKTTGPDEGKTVAKLKSSVSRLQQAVKGISLQRMDGFMTKRKARGNIP